MATKVKSAANKWWAGRNRTGFSWRGGVGAAGAGRGMFLIDTSRGWDESVPVITVHVYSSTVIISHLHSARLQHAVQVQLWFNTAPV